ncbi:MAG TPA: NlpC/P60 family protein [Gaiellaceae bacterium]|nr:NlpC/P60 family protein [Gaiellaceae bacterium]
MGCDDVVNSSKRKALAILTFLTAISVAVALGSVKTAAADPNVDAKRAQAQDVLNEIQAIDSQLELAIEEYNHANVKLDGIKAEARLNARHLTIARSSLQNAQTHLSARLVSLYVNGGEGNALEVMLGARSLDDLLSRMDAVERVSDQDAKVLREVTRFRSEVKQRKLRLDRARTAQARVVAQKESQRRSIESQLAERQRMLSSIKSEIASLQAAEQLRQRRLEAQAQARLAAQSAQGQGFATDQQVAALAAPSVESALAPAPAARYGGVVGVAMQFLGVPYVWGGASPSGFDCSGLIMYAYSQVGVSLPHHAASQYGMGVAVSRDQLQPGDLVFFNGLGHAGIYIGGGQFIHAPHSGDVVKISSLSDSWYAATWVGARRL